MQRKVQIEEADAYELLSYLVSSADTCTHEPHYYGTFRLLDAASRLIGSMLRDPQFVGDVWLAAFKLELDDNKLRMMTNRDRYLASIPQATHAVAEEVKRREADWSAQDHAERRGNGP